MSAPPPAALPTRNGVGPSCVALPPGDWPTLLDFLSQRFPGVAREVWQRRMAGGEVLDEQGLALAADTPFRPRTRAFYYRALAQERRIPFDETVLYQDADLVVVDKPHFLPVTPTGRFVQESLLVRLKRRLGIDSLQPAHRLDRETAGLVLFSVRRQSRDAYHRLFRERLVHKQYEAVAHWHADLDLPLERRSLIVQGSPFICMREAAGEPNSHTAIALLQVRGPRALYRLTPLTGRKHQLRVHMAALGLPICNDPLYPQLLNIADDDFSRPLQLLARSLEFTDPLTGQPRKFESRQALQWS